MHVYNVLLSLAPFYNPKLNYGVCFSSALCGVVSTVWFPIGAYQEHGLMSFGFSLYTGWFGSIFCLLGGCILTCCSSESSSSRSYQDNNRYYYSKQGGGNPPAAPSTNHAKSAHV